MALSNIKYSIILPARNGGKYIASCVDSIISQDYGDYELIISDDHSTDSTPEYLKTLSNPHIKVVHPPAGLSMAEHWEWALNGASGEWLIFVGQDDGLQPYFFELAERLTDLAERKNVRTIMSERAYYFWPGCSEYYGDTAVSYRATCDFKILDWRYQSFKALLGFQNYFELPEMYTTSIFKRSIIEEAKKKQNGKLFVAHPQDASLAAIGMSLDKKYLKSGIPLGWVGSSPKSAGLAVVAGKPEKGGEDALENVRSDYLQKISKSRILTHVSAGDFTIGSTILYYWGALLQTQPLRNAGLNEFLLSPLFKKFLFGAAYLELKNYKNNRDRARLDLFNDVLDMNKFSLPEIKIYSAIIYIIHKAGRLCGILFRNRFKKRVSYKACWDGSPGINLEKASSEVNRLLKRKHLFDRMFVD
jgi:glycosyltransferase involved in cell wall biosynthesis